MVVVFLMGLSPMWHVEKVENGILGDILKESREGSGGLGTPG